MRRKQCVLFLAVDGIISPRGLGLADFAEFSVALERAVIPVVWVTRRTRLQIDAPRRRYGHNHPFIAEGASGVYLPQGYFHLKPEAHGSGTRQAATVRLGRFTCLPVAEPQPAAAEALESLSQDLGVAVVSLRTLSSRELAQNTGLPVREAELVRQRDFDELFFFAGASQRQTQRFQDEAGKRGFQLRQQGPLWSLSVGAGIRDCVKRLSKLYDRARRERLTSIAVATCAEGEELLSACDRYILLTVQPMEETEPDRTPRRRMHQIPVNAQDLWDQLLERIIAPG